MKINKASLLKKYSLAIGIAAGFVSLGMLFSIWEGKNSNAVEIFITVGIIATSMTVFLQSMETKKTKTCKASTHHL